MLSLVLRRAQTQLQAHRQWLGTFATLVYGRGSITGRQNVNATAPALSGGGLQHRVRSFIHSTAFSSKAKKPKRKVTKAPRPTPSEASEPDHLIDLRLAIEDVDINALTDLVPIAKKSGVLDRTLTWRIAQCVHEDLRRRKRLFDDQKRRDSIDALVRFGVYLAKSIRKGELEPDRRAHMHLIGFFKEAGARGEGVTFWNWLEGQDDHFVDADVYGAAIDLLAVNGVPLTELESLYVTALERFPGSFNAYHMSPNAIVPDRDQATDVKGISMMLLQGILTARLLHGDSHNAYLALETALRLYPALTPPRFFTMFIEERPISEAYTVLAMACRAGIVLPFDTTRKMLTALRSHSDSSSIEGHVNALRQMLSVVYMYTGAGGTATSNLANEIVIALTQTLRLPGVSALAAEEKKRVVNETLSLIRSVLEILARFGAKPGISAFNSLIVYLAGHGGSKQVLSIALKDIEALGLRPNNVTRRSILTAAGLLGDAELVTEAWRDLVDAKALQGERLDASDYHILVKAAKLSNATDFAIEACEGMVADLREEQREDVYERLYSSADEWETDVQPLEVSELSIQLDRLRADLAFMDDRTKDGPATQDFSEQHLPVTLAPMPDKVRLPESELRKLYDALSTEQSTSHTADAPPQFDALTPATDAKPSSTQRPPALSTTEIPFGELRYENWRCINYLLALSEQHDEAYNRAVDEAIAAGVRPPSREKVLRAAGKAVMGEGEGGVAGVGGGLSDTEIDGASAFEPDAEMTEEGIQKARKEILRLRGRLAAAEDM